ncbi:MAG: carboxymethylenebutenolidase [Aquabacterium sp.]|nr:MAG: carboxymethylenebutenolidase [Aquabacterium sp.]
MSLEDDFDSLLPQPAWTRRSFMQGAVGTGFAAAVLPVGAQTIRTDTQGITAGPVTIPVAGRTLPGYASRPAAEPGKAAGPLPVIVVISEIFGVHEHIADITRRLAKQGYLAVAPELFVRQGDAKGYTDIPKLLAEVVSKVPDEQVLSDLDATVAWATAAAQGGDSKRVGVTGFCWGGRITWLYAAHGPVKAAVAWYGKLVGESTPLQPKHPIDLVPALRAPVLGLYGGQDGGIPLSTVERMQQALSAGDVAARSSQIVIYPDAPHAFHADYRPSYRTQAAQDGWQRCLGWFSRHLGA